jgi:diadenosine tetraphosphate (Ap4A) HIT family hydrolase
MKHTASKPPSHLQKQINGKSIPINIHPQLQADCIILGRFPLCHLLLMNDSNYPWFVLVPEREDITEIHQLDIADQHQLISESSTLSRCIEQLFDADKINIAALGNIVPQLHIHHIVRYRTDAAWPAPVWGKLAAIPYTEDQLEQIIDKLKHVSIAELEHQR